MADHLSLAPYLTQLLLSTQRLVLLSGAGSKRELLSALARFMGGPGIVITEHAVPEREHRTSLSALLDKLVHGKGKGDRSNVAVSAVVPASAANGGKSRRRLVRQVESAPAGAAPLTPASEVAAAAAASAAVAAAADVYAANEMTPPDGATAASASAVASAAAFARALDAAVRRDAEEASRPVHILVIHSLDRAFLRDNGAGAALLRPLPPHVRILASVDNASVVFHALDERHRIALNILEYEVPTYALEGERTLGVLCGGGGSRSFGSGAAAVSSTVPYALSDYVDDDTISVTDTVAAAAAGGSVGASSRDGVDKAVRSLPPAMHHVMRLLLALAEAASGGAGARAHLLRVDPLALFEEANARMLVSSEHALARMLNELADAHLVSLHGDGSISIDVDATHLKDSLRAAMQGGAASR